MGEEFFTPVQDTESPPYKEPQPESKGGIFGNIKNIFSGGENGGLSFDLDTVFLLILVYFLIADGEENSTETLIIVAALILFGF